MFIEPTLTTWMHTALTRKEQRPPAGILAEAADIVMQEPISTENRSQAEVVVQFVDAASSRRPRSRRDGAFTLDGQQVAVYDDQGRDLNIFVPCDETGAQIERFH